MYNLASTFNTHIAPDPRRRAAAVLLLVWAIAIIAYYFRITPAALTGLADPIGPLFDGARGRTFPQLPSAARRAGVAIATVFLILTPATLAGAFVARLLGWRSEHPGQRFATHAALGFGGFALLGLLLALVGLYRPIVLRALTIGPTVAWLIVMGWKNSPAGSAIRSRACSARTCRG